MSETPERPARRVVFNHLVEPVAGGGPMSHEQARAALDALRAEDLSCGAAAGGGFRPERTYTTGGSGFTAPEELTYFKVSCLTQRPETGQWFAYGWVRQGTRPWTPWAQPMDSFDDFTEMPPAAPAPQVLQVLQGAPVADEGEVYCGNRIRTGCTRSESATSLQAKGWQQVGSEWLDPQCAVDRAERMEYLARQAARDAPPLH